MINKYIKYDNGNGDERYGLILDKVEHVRDYNGFTDSYVVGVIEEFYDHNKSQIENELKEKDYNSSGYGVELISPRDINRYFQNYGVLCRFYHQNK